MTLFAGTHEGITMDVFEAIAKRHSYRGPFAETTIPREHLQQIVQAGLQAPSGKNAQTTDFVIIDEPDVVKQINTMPAANKAIQQARAFVVCIIDKNPEAIYEGFNFQVEDCAAAVENMLLAITALGYATVWTDGWLRVQNRNGQIGELIGLPENKIVRIILPLGTPQETRPKKEKEPFEQRAWFNRYGKS